MAARKYRPGRTLLIFLVTVGILYGLAAIGGTWKPRLGLDLEGGTRITLVAEGKAPSAEKLDLAASIINQRVNGSGVTESEVSTQGDRNVVVEIPGQKRQDLVDAVMRTAVLRFRLVAYCSQITGSFCIASGQPQKQSSDQPSSSPSPSAEDGNAGDKTGKPGKQGKKKDGAGTPGDQDTAAPSDTEGANPRPAPAYAVQADEPDPKPTKKADKKADKKAGDKGDKAGDGPSTPAAPTATAGGAKLTDYLAWSKDPGTVWQLIFGISRCDPQSGQALVPALANTIDAADPPPVEQLQKKLGKVQADDLVRMKDDPARPLVSCDEDGNKYLQTIAVINGTDLSSASSGLADQSLGAYAVFLDFKSAAAKTFADLSRKMWDGSGSPYAGGQFAIVLDGNTLSAPGFDGVIPDGSAQITGDFTEASASSLANSLKFGALPVKFAKDVSVQTIGPSLAGNQLGAGLIAGAIGLGIVMIYCLFYYRGLGLVVLASLVIAAIITYAVVLVLAKTAGFALTLPGMAGLIVGVGITADSFIVYFERIRDEMRAGKSMRVAVQVGWARARNTCLAADAVSILAAVVLYIFAIGVVRGFAFALGVSTLIDVAVFFWFTHPMMTLLSHRRFFNSGNRFSGLSPETLGVDADPRLAGGRI